MQKIKISKIISASRRTDIPAYYGDWFLNRINKGIIGYKNPFNGEKYFVSLKKNDVYCIVFWSKNYIPFINKLKLLNKLNYNFYLIYTINGYPDIFEKNVIKKELQIENFKKLSNIYSNKKIIWRYDPIIYSTITDYNFHINNFKNICSELSTYTSKCYISFVSFYNKVKNNFNIIQKKESIKIFNPEEKIKIQLANELATIADNYNIQIYTCCCDYLINDKIKKGKCIDSNLINQLFNFNYHFKSKPTREGCGCAESIDIGAYNTCIHNCVYCYANLNKKTALDYYMSHDKNSIILNHFKSESKI